MFDWVWAEWLWFPENLAVGWKDLENNPGTGIYYPQFSELHWSLLLGVAMLPIRYLLSRFIFMPLGFHLGIPRVTRQHVLSPQPALEAAYKQNKTLTGKQAERLSKGTDLTVRQVQIWFRRRKQNDTTQPIHKFAECGWHLLFYGAACIGGLTVLWDKPWLTNTEYNWIDWPFQHVTDGVYWYYMIESAFYWSLVFTLCVDHQRKHFLDIILHHATTLFLIYFSWMLTHSDFHEMILHHATTLFLIYFSWMLNFVRAGSLVLLIHDASDPFLALAKMMSYTKNTDDYSTAFFICFLVIWVVSRIYFYPFVILYSTTIQPYIRIDKTFFGHWFFNVLLYGLMVLHLMWTYSIFRIAINKVRAGKMKDVRSDSEGADTDDENSSLNGRLSNHTNNNLNK